MSTQTELRVVVPTELVDPLEAHFVEAESFCWGVMQREKDDPYEIFGFFPDEASALEELAALRQSFPELPEAVTLSTINDADWQNAYKEFVKPWSDRMLHWVPLWEKPHVAIPQGHTVVYLDAGMAFGTGAHETTRLCARRLLDFLEESPQSTATASLIDAGCGSGILALSAAGLGFKNVYGFDFDPDAIGVCRENIDYNPQISTGVEFAVADLATGLDGRKADLLLANIQTDVLIPNADHLIRALKPEGILALSGILAREVAEVQLHYCERFDSLGLGPVTWETRIDGEWADLLIRRQC